MSFFKRLKKFILMLFCRSKPEPCDCGNDICDGNLCYRTINSSII